MSKKIQELIAILIKEKIASIYLKEHLQISMNSSKVKFKITSSLSITMKRHSKKLAIKPICLKYRVKNTINWPVSSVTNSLFRKNVANNH